MVCLYTRIDDFNDVIMRERDDRFEIETRNRKDIFSQFSLIFYKIFEKDDEESAEKMYKDLTT